MRWTPPSGILVFLVVGGCGGQADGSARYAPPRFAGIDAGGEVAITGSRLELRQSLVWVSFDYRWISIRDGVAREAKATALLTPRENGGWKIVHLHTSTTRE